MCCQAGLPWWRATQVLLACRPSSVASSVFGADKMAEKWEKLGIDIFVSHIPLLVDGMEATADQS